MADDTQEPAQKTEDPTPKRLEEAFRSGRAFYSREITSFLILVSLLLLVSSFWYIIGKPFFSLRYYFENVHNFELTSHNFRKLIVSIGTNLFLPFLPLFIIMAIAILSPLIQVGRFVVSLDNVRPNFSKLSPLRGLQRLFSTRNLLEFGKNILKILILGFVVYLVAKPELKFIQFSYSYDVGSINKYLHALLLRILSYICALVGIMAILDYFYQRFAFYQQLRMSKQELKEEFRETEGSPEVKARLKQLRAERAKRRMISEVPKADVVITNPTHYAVALKYEQAKMNAPIVIAKGIDNTALKIREIAFANDVAVIENPPLAKALYNSTKLGEEINVEHYKVVAEIISYVYKLRKKKG